MRVSLGDAAGDPAIYGPTQAIPGTGWSNGQMVTASQWQQWQHDEMAYNTSQEQKQYQLFQQAVAASPVPAVAALAPAVQQAAQQSAVVSAAATAPATGVTPPPVTDSAGAVTTGTPSSSLILILAVGLFAFVLMGKK